MLSMYVYLSLQKPRSNRIHYDKWRATQYPTVQEILPIYYAGGHAATPANGAGMYAGSCGFKTEQRIVAKEETHSGQSPLFTHPSIVFF